MLVRLQLGGALSAHDLEALRLEIDRLAGSCGLDITQFEVASTPSRDRRR
jgi:hypothetical protein